MRIGLERVGQEGIRAYELVRDDTEETCIVLDTCIDIPQDILRPDELTYARYKLTLYAGNAGDLDQLCENTPVPCSAPGLPPIFDEWAMADSDGDGEIDAVLLTTPLGNVLLPIEAYVVE